MERMESKYLVKFYYQVMTILFFETNMISQADIGNTAWLIKVVMIVSPRLTIVSYYYFSITLSLVVRLSIRMFTTFGRPIH